MPPMQDKFSHSTESGDELVPKRGGGRRLSPRARTRARERERGSPRTLAGRRRKSRLGCGGRVELRAKRCARIILLAQKNRERESSEKRAVLCNVPDVE